MGLGAARKMSWCSDRLRKNANVEPGTKDGITHGEPTAPEIRISTAF